MVGPAAPPITERIRERAVVSRPPAAEQPARTAGSPRTNRQVVAVPERIPGTRAEDDVPAWKRRILDVLASALERKGASRESRIDERLTADNVDARITSLSRELRARARDRTGYDQPGAVRLGVVVNEAV